MTDIHIPPAALEAGARAILKEWTDLNSAEAAARAAFLAMLKAWPGMNTGPNIYGRQDAIIHLPLPQEKADG